MQQDLDAIKSALARLEMGKKQSSAASWLVPAAISASVALAVAFVANLLLSPKDHLEHLRAITKTQGEIIRACHMKDTQPVGALLIIFELEPLYTKFKDVKSIWGEPSTADYEKFRSTVTECVTDVADGGKQAPSAARAPGDEVPAKAINFATSPNPSLSTGLSPEKIIAEFNSSNRLTFSNQLIATYAGKPDELVRVLTRAILTDDSRSYRVNLYIVFTLARLPQGWPKLADPNDLIGNLVKTNNYKNDSTFRKRVDEAIANRTV